ncbi:uncharacterized protein LOC111308476 [Durio zibethinus]|uniref:Uncharacterized protein LOC111308476 n=1 Tax=Durio zibethinus TaxID=66656 RepID=A0A6P6ACG5_DURZI|nr:uncharacterized protein LOC111308476 [Durio zibethinus]
MAMQRRVSPRFQDLPNGSNSSIEKISNATDSKRPPNTRVSPRLQSIRLEKRPYYGCSRKKKPFNDSQDKLMVKKLKVDHSISECVSNIYDLDNGSVTAEKDVADLQETGSKQGNYGDILASIPGISMAMAVKNKFRLFNKYYLHFAKVHFVQGKVSRVLSESPGLVCKDISNGQEDKCIPVLNLYNPSVAPTGKLS